MHFPAPEYVAAITEDRRREAEAARLARSVATEKPRPAGPTRRRRRLAARLAAFTTLR